MAKYHLTNKAVADISDIWEYTLKTWSEKQADKYYMLLLDACATIAEKPSAGKSYAEVMPDLLGYRVGSHIIFYMVISDKEIEVLRFLHSRMDLRGKME